MPPSPALLHFKEIGSFKDTLTGSEKKHVVIRKGKQKLMNVDVKEFP